MPGDDPIGLLALFRDRYDLDTEIVYRCVGEPHAATRRLMATLGVRIEIEPEGEPVSVSAQEATRTIDCRAPGCTNTAATDRGIYAYLCDQHADQKRRTGVSPRPLDSSASATRPRASSDSLEAKVKELGRLGRDADRARAKARTAAESAMKLKAAADTLEQAFRARTRELMGEG